ncbi:MAG TPA: ankyrin repeat domain-containing protein, partial [Alphaproteobacteria bacterium]|nr:ankyrin repeat domain-containing protein [Alphaproteobacteria bacterium]
MTNKKQPKKPVPAARDGFNAHHVREPDKVLDPKTGRTRLIDALLKEDMAQVEKLLKAGAAANKQTKDGKTPLHYVARLGNTAAINLLVTYGARVNLVDNNKQTPLFDALAAPQPSRVLNALFKAGADADLPDKDGRIPLHDAAEKASLFLVRRLLQHTENPNRPDKKGTQPLHLAAAHNSLAVVQTILFERVAVFSADHNGDTCLHHAVKREDSDVAEYLLKTEAARMVNAVNLDGRSPLHVAAEKKNKKLLQIMVAAGGDVNLPDRKGFTPLHDAITSNDIKTVKLLIENGADISKPTAGMRVTPLILAIQQKGDREIVRLLLEHDASAKAADDEGITPLMVAARNGDLPLMQVLLETGADPAAIDKRKQNVL